MVICLKNPIRQLMTTHEDSIIGAATNLAADVLLYGQGRTRPLSSLFLGTVVLGNSGTILSHFFISLAEELKAAGVTVSISIAELCVVLARAGQKMSSAVANAVDGTLVSTARDCSQGLAGNNIQEVCKQWAAQAEAEVAKTPDQLKDPKTGKMVLQEAGVVDSGAKGFMYHPQNFS
jgi:dihydroxyacetone kinase-like predicted kinase